MTLWLFLFIFLSGAQAGSNNNTGIDSDLLRQATALLGRMNSMTLAQDRDCLKELFVAITRPQELDQCDFIRSAIDTLPAKGGTVTIPAGHYTCGSPIILGRSHISLRGIGAVTLRLGNHANSPLILMGSPETPPPRVEDVEISNLNLDGNKDHQDGECWGGACDSGGHSYVRNNGVTIRGVTNGRVENVNVKSARSGGLVTEKGSAKLLVRNFSATDSFFDGIGGCETSDSIFTNLNLYKNHNAGISLDLGFNGNTISNAVLNANHDEGIFMRNSSHNHFNDVRIQKPGSFGIFVASSELANSCPEYNDFRNLAVIDSPKAAFRLANSCLGNTLSGANYFSNDRACVSTVSGAQLDIHGKIVCD